MTDARPPVLEDPVDGLGPSSMPGEAFRIALPNFEGPLDLLLHLIREHKLDILDIPVALITEKYLESLERMREINLDIAGEFLVMASTLAHIKSRMLLPRQELAAPVDEAPPDEIDPRAELVRRLLEYQKYKAVAEKIAQLPVLDRDVFCRRAPPEGLVAEDEDAELMELSVYKLIEALDRILAERAPELPHEVTRERVSLSAAMARVTEMLRARGEVRFAELFEGRTGLQALVITFLALLELCKLRLVRVSQAEGEGDIRIAVRGDALGLETPLEVDESEYR